MIETREQLKPIQESILNEKMTLANMPPSHEGMDDNTLMTRLKPWRHELIEVYANSILTGPEKSKEAIERWGEAVAGLLVSLEMPLDVALTEITYYRDRMGELIKNEAEEKGFSFKTLYAILSEFNAVVDQATQKVSQMYMREYANNIEVAKYAIDELSVPLVQLTDDVGIIPIIGEIDTKRAQYLMTNALDKGSDFGLNYIILDLSGVSVIDTMVAAQIFKVTDALKLIGIKTMISGVRPEIAQTMVSLGIKVDIKIYSTLRQAFKHLSDESGGLTI
ncbi:rsbT co-antagonist protein RsbR [Alkalihalobacillus xiaoxiensis]|uniref:RsbT co-antagonist protein RsbR n=1 Tax=Shouchella xiaoxiensis TaxID=766895 RepID=A0ABS2SXG4_9BACI|nr:STAS domain-containing protein [Shouchella xiaoxiensis]MBM7839460.1 rsbT co-antagonist protein RsbR [Shouchella xiaoxiensis]